MNVAIIRRALEDAGYIELPLKSISVMDDLEGNCKVALTVGDEVIEGLGVGLVDASFNALKEHYAREYESLNSITLRKFHVGVNKASASGAGTDALCRVELEINNSHGNIFEFSHDSRSLVASAAVAVSRTVEFFINSERAFITISNAVNDAKDRGRQDLVTRFTAELAEVVRNTSYTSTIERIKEQLNI